MSIYRERHYPEDMSWSERKLVDLFTLDNSYHSVRAEIQRNTIFLHFIPNSHFLCHFCVSNFKIGQPRRNCIFQIL